MVTYHFYCFFFRNNAWWRTFRESFKIIHREIFFLRNHLKLPNVIFRQLTLFKYPSMVKLERNPDYSVRPPLVIWRSLYYCWISQIMRRSFTFLANVAVVIPWNMSWNSTNFRECWQCGKFQAPRFASCRLLGTRSVFLNVYFCNTYLKHHRDGNRKWMAHT